MPTSKRNRLFQALTKYFDPDEASDLADYLQNVCPGEARVKIEENEDGFYVLINDEVIISTVTRGEAVLVCNDLMEALA